MPAVQKPPKSTPESRRAEKQKRTLNPLKAQILHREPIRDQDQTPTIKAKPAEPDLYRVAGSSLPTISAKRLKTLDGKRLTSTFAPKPGVRRLQRTAMVKGKQIKRVIQRTGRMALGTKLRPVGVQGKRLAPGDRKAAQGIKGLSCICGCNRPVQWMHLQRRAVLSTRHEEWATAPGCDDLHHWLDQGKGTAVRPELFKLAEALGRRLIHADAYKHLSDAGYYTWLHHERRIL